jgi:glycosyltransferase involved in cell wall biosynthesis
MSNNKITIITAVYNGESTLEDLIQSVLSQDDKNVEFIVIDGNSTDNTKELIEKYSPQISYWCSEPDLGIYDAWNKGISQATGDWIMFMGCDDLLKPNAIKNYTRFLSELVDLEKVDLVSSRMEMIDQNGILIRTKGWPWEWPKFVREVTIAHPGALHSKRLFAKYGHFDIGYKIVGDFEFLLRPKAELIAKFMNEVTVTMREGGASDSVHAIFEHYHAATKTAGYPKFKAALNCVLVLAKYFTKKLARTAGVNLYLNK